MAMILEASIDSFKGFLEKLVQEEVAMLLGVKDEIESLQSKLQVLSIVVADAERQRMHNDAINGWIKKFKDFMYDADDILDLYRIEADKNVAFETKPSVYSRSEKWGCNNFRRLPCLPLPICFRNPIFAHKIGKRIRTLNSRLSEISKEKDLYGFIPLTNSPRDEIMASEISEKTDSTVESDLVGTKIKEDTRNLVRLLTKTDTTENVLVFAIVGLGGIGKTTLAQLTFNDSTMKQFPLRVWLSVTKTFNENDLLKEVIREVGGDYGGAVSRNQLVNELVKYVTGKKFLIVLDDVWNVSVWEKLLRNPLSKGAAGSRVLVTTRDETVANMMRAVYSHKVDTLSLEDGWSLLCKKLVLRGNEWEIEHLKDIGIKIVEKCGGLPLAIKVMGSALCGKSRSEWESVLKSNVWSISGFPEQVNRAIFWSYLQLPPHLKQCFLWWFLLPKGYERSMYRVGYLWIAEGFIKDQGELSALMEETGDQYYKELVRRSFLQLHPVYVQNVHIMHDLLRSLAEFLTQDESLFVDGQERLSNQESSKKLRRLSIEGGELYVGDIMRSEESLRTLLLWKNESRHLNGLLEHLPFLRVLEIGYSKIEELPDTVTSLAHLRYLGLARTQIRELPENIRDLKNLQVLDLHDCEKLDRLPTSVVFLKNLRFLDVSGTRVEGIPAGIRRLTHLSYLCGYRLQCPKEAEGAPTITTSKWSTLEELGPLENLRLLKLLNLEAASSSSEAKPARLTEKSHLIKFTVECSKEWTNEASEVDVKRMEEIYEALQPPTCLEHLWLTGYPCSRLPGWVTATGLPNLTTLTLEGCKYCENLSFLGKLPNLVYLAIREMPSIISIGPEFMGETGDGKDGKGKRPLASSVSFPKLEHLTIKCMGSWEKWVWDRELCGMPRLQELWLGSCPKLISLPEGLSCQATALRLLSIKDAGSLKSVGNCYSLPALQLYGCSSLERVFDLPALDQLLIGRSPSLNVVENLSSSLQYMQISVLEMESLPMWLSESEKSPKPEKLVIYCSQALFTKMWEMGGEEWPKIRHINHVEIRKVSERVVVERVIYTREPFSFTRCK